MELSTTEEFKIPQILNTNIQECQPPYLVMHLLTRNVTVIKLVVSVLAYFHILSQPFFLYTLKSILSMILLLCDDIFSYLVMYVIIRVW